MTDAEWLACSDPKPMLEFLNGKASDRKLRMFAISCYRSVRDQFRIKLGDSAVEVAEQFAEGLLTAEKMAAARDAIPGAPEMYPTKGNPAYDLPYLICVTDMQLSAELIANIASKAFTYPSKVAQDRIRLAEMQRQCEFLRDIFSFHPITLSPSWLTSTVVSLANQMYDTRDFSAMPILADALMDASCDNETILTHCRGLGPHTRGCWVIDLILSK
jgi:hypothetical protein